MTANQYFDMCEQLGKVPNPDEIPPSWDDIPEIAQQAINIFNSLGDRNYPEIGYQGKDYTNLPIHLDIYEIENKELLVEILSWLDARAIKENADKLKREYEKLKRKK